MISFFKKRPHLLILGLILLIGLFFRTYEIVERFEFAHDGDLYSWIAKDIIVNKHPRLLGQLTTAPGIFIGPAFYYLLVPFFLVTNMDPIGTVIPTTIIGLLTILSYYFIFSKIFNAKVGLIASFLYAVLLTNAGSDRWVVPTNPTNLWVVWYFYTILMISRGKYFLLPVLGVLIGLIWHIHIALVPTLIAIPAAFFVARKLPDRKQILFFFTALFITSIPLIAFEIRHGFSQTHSLIGNFSSEHGGGTGFSKLFNVLNMIVKNINALFFAPQSLPIFLKPIFVILLFLSTLFISFKRKLISKEDLFPLLIWIIGVVGFFTISSSLISEYYFYSIEIIFTTLVSLTLYFIYKSSKLGAFLIIILLVIILIKNLYSFTFGYIYHKGYVEKKALVNYIVQDAKIKGFPCVGISYITTPGENVGFRYFFYLANLHLTHPSIDVPVYNIVIPDEFSTEVKQKFGHIGLIPPTNIPADDVIKKNCEGPNTNLTDPMFGFVN